MWMWQTYTLVVSDYSPEHRGVACNVGDAPSTRLVSTEHTSPRISVDGYSDEFSGMDMKGLFEESMMVGCSGVAFLGGSIGVVKAAVNKHKL